MYDFTFDAHSIARAAVPKLVIAQIEALQKLLHKLAISQDPTNSYTDRASAPPQIAAFPMAKRRQEQRIRLIHGT